MSSIFYSLYWQPLTRKIVRLKLKNPQTWINLRISKMVLETRIELARELPHPLQHFWWRETSLGMGFDKKFFAIGGLFFLLALKLTVRDSARLLKGWNIAIS